MPPDLLTEKELDALRLIQLMQKDAAHRLGTTVGAIKGRLSRVYRKLGIEGVSGTLRKIKAITEAIRLGIITLEDLEDE